MDNNFRVLSAGDLNSFRFDTPDTCPMCHNKIIPLRHSGFVFRKNSFNHYRVIYSCPNNNCLELFIGYYSQFNGYNEIISPSGIRPFNYIPEVFSERITKVSPSFVEAYNQSIQAEKFNLSEICGMGFRKSLEFLIKDYLVYKNPEKEDTIKNNHRLSSVIDEYIDDKKIKDMAHRGAWLGNDHSHYIKKWEDKDLSDLKVLIKTTLFWIEAELEYDHYLKEMK